MNKKTNNHLTISIVTPVYNEIGNIELFYSRTKKSLLSSNLKHEMIFINDGSTDDSLEKILQIAKKDNSVKIICLSRNFGHQIAITAGIDYCEGDAAVIIDSDLQDPPELIPALIKTWQEGFEVVHAVRKNRKDTWFKKVSAKIFYRLFSLISDVSSPLDSGDFRLIDRKVINELVKLREGSRYFRGLVPWLGFRQTSVYFDRDKRKSGISKYSLTKMIGFSFDAITSFSTTPLKLISILGSIFTLSGLSLGVFLLIKHQPINTNAHLVSILTAIIFLASGTELLAMGLLGEYLGRTYSETQKRPLYIVRELTNISKQTTSPS